MKTLRTVHITNSGVTVNGATLPVSAQGAAILTELYRSHVGDYAKFFKMDILCKLGFIATELLLEGEEGRFVPRYDRAVLIFSRCGCIDNDRNYLASVTADGYFPSPSLFVYTLPNIVTGEISIRNKYRGDTTAYLLPEYDEAGINANLEAAFTDPATDSAVCGWLECSGPDSFEAILKLMEK